MGAAAEHSADAKFYLKLTDEEYQPAKEKDPTIRKHARQLFEYGEAREGYWTSLSQTAKNEVSQRRRIVCMFDHSSCHAAMPKTHLMWWKLMFILVANKEYWEMDGTLGWKTTAKELFFGHLKGT